jgi:L,D-transpeptidase YcbB
MSYLPIGRFGCFLFFVSCYCFACHDSQKGPAGHPSQDSSAQKVRQGDPSMAGEFSSQTVFHFDSNAIRDFLAKYPLFRNLQGDIQTFYGQRRYAYAWFDREGLIEQAENLYNHLVNIGEEGVPDKILYKDSLSTLFDVYASPMQRRSPENELMLTAQYFWYAKTAWGGISEKATRGMDWFLPRKKMDLPSLMDSLLRDSSSGIIHRGYANRQYALLRDYLKRYRDLESKKPWTPVQADRPTYQMGDSSPVVADIREKLFLLGDLSVNSGSPVFDPALEEAVKHFQARAGMNEDGRLGAGTLRKINIPPATYIRKILVNMERSRWIPVSIQDDYIIVNIPAFLLFSFENDSLQFIMKVVVGKAMHKTVIFNGNLQYVVFSPYWNVPPDILKNEVLPGIRKNPDYLRRNNMEWNGNNIRQKPGPKNSLGLVKFLFPNSYNIYLHDSPAKSLFNQDTRAFSHGCIRVGEPKKLATYLLRKQPEWTESKIDAAMHSGKEKYVTLKTTVPVFIAYLTAWVDRQGQFNFRDDIYKRDDRLESMMLKQNK